MPSDFSVAPEALTEKTKVDKMRVDQSFFIDLNDEQTEGPHGLAYSGLSC